MECFTCRVISRSVLKIILFGLFFTIGTQVYLGASKKKKQADKEMEEVFGNNNEDRDSGQGVTAIENENFSLNPAVHTLQRLVSQRLRTEDYGPTHERNNQEESQLSIVPQVVPQVEISNFVSQFSLEQQKQIKACMVSMYQQGKTDALRDALNKSVLTNQEFGSVTESIKLLQEQVQKLSTAVDQFTYKAGEVTQNVNTNKTDLETLKKSLEQCRRLCNILNTMVTGVEGSGLSHQVQQVKDALNNMQERIIGLRLTVYGDEENRDDSLVALKLTCQTLKHSVDALNAKVSALEVHSIPLQVLNGIIQKLVSAVNLCGINSNIKSFHQLVIKGPHFSLPCLMIGFVGDFVMRKIFIIIPPIFNLRDVAYEPIHEAFYILKWSSAKVFWGQLSKPVFVSLAKEIPILGTYIDPEKQLGVSESLTKIKNWTSERWNSVKGFCSRSKEAIACRLPSKRVVIAGSVGCGALCLTALLYAKNKKCNSK